ncbi:hypothetical protein [Rosistilla oblonga]|uniref:hypothetical protein n=1 Tax=Rosistilla oblonga TaxID=2527990 RepID=UPI003A971671
MNANDILANQALAADAVLWSPIGVLFVDADSFLGALDRLAANVDAWERLTTQTEGYRKLLEPAIPSDRLFMAGGVTTAHQFVARCMLRHPYERMLCGIESIISIPHDDRDANLRSKTFWTELAESIRAERDVAEIAKQTRAGMREMPGMNWWGKSCESVLDGLSLEACTLVQSLGKEGNQPTGPHETLTANDRMLQMLNEDARRCNWRQTKWAGALGVTERQVSRLPAWKALRAMNREKRTGHL